MPNPQRERPPRTVITKALAARDPALRRLYLDLHALALKTLPDVAHTLDLADGVMSYGARQYGADGWGIAWLACYARWVTLGFMRGADLPDLRGLLTGRGKHMRHVKVATADELAGRRAGIRALLLAAAGRRR